jgi:hypothetical protein
MNLSAILTTPEQAKLRLAALFRDFKHELSDGRRLFITIKSESRSNGQNAALHAWIGEIAKSLTIAGQRHDSEVWKRALVAAWSRTRGEAVLVIPALDGQGVDLVPRRTSQLTKAECADLLEYVICYASENGVGVEPEAQAA